MKHKDLYEKITSHIDREVKKLMDRGALADQTDYEKICRLFNLEELLTDDILSFMSKCPMRLSVDRSGFGGPYTVRDGSIQLNEPAPTRTYDVSEVTKLAAPKLGLNLGNVISVVFANNVDTCVLIVNKFDNKDFVIEGMRAFGWSFSHSDNASCGSYEISVLHFDPIFQEVANSEIEKCSNLYHWAPKYKYERIMNYGLMPKSNNYDFSYPPKIHLIKGFADDATINHIGKQLCDENKDSRNNREYVLLNVNASPILDKVKLIYDPRYEFGYYTKQNIDKSCITKNRETTF